MMIKERRIYISQEPYYDVFEEVLNVQEFALNGEEILERTLLFFTVDKETLQAEMENSGFMAFTPRLDFEHFGKLPDGFKDEMLKNIFETKKSMLENAATLPIINSFEDFLELCSAATFDEHERRVFNQLLN